MWINLSEKLISHMKALEPGDFSTPQLFFPLIFPLFILDKNNKEKNPKT